MTSWLCRKRGHKFRGWEGSSLPFWFCRRSRCDAYTLAPYVTAGDFGSSPLPHSKGDSDVRHSDDNAQVRLSGETP